MNSKTVPGENSFVTKDSFLDDDDEVRKFYHHNEKRPNMLIHQSAGALYVLAAKILSQQLVVTVAEGPCVSLICGIFVTNVMINLSNILLTNIFYIKITDFAL